MPHDITREVEKIAEDLGIDRKRSIGEVAKELKVETHVIRFWEENFPQIKPEIGAGKRRYYYNKQLKILKRIKKFLYEEGYTIAGLQKLLSRKKHDESELEEDLEIIAKETPAEEKITPKKVAREIELEDFINPEIEIETGAKISPKARLSDFSNIKMSAIDPRLKQEISQSLKNAKVNLSKLKNLLKNL